MISHSHKLGKGKICKQVAKNLQALQLIDYCTADELQCLTRLGTGSLKSNVIKCASCAQIDLPVLYDFGQVPLAGYFPIPNHEDALNCVDMRLLRCKTCGLVQIDPIIEDRYLFSDYRYRSFFAMNNHFLELSDWLVTKGFQRGSKIIEIGSNDGTLLKHLIDKGFNPIGIDPAENIVQHSKKLGHTVLVGHFSKKFVEKNGLAEKFSLAISCNSFAHIQGIRDVASAVYESLAPDGYFLIEVQSWEELLKLKALDFVYHEHKYYYDKYSIEFLLALEGFKLVSAEIVGSHGGSWRCLFRKGKEIPVTEFKYERPHSSESDLARHAISEFFLNLRLLEKKLEVIKSGGGKIIGFGASGRANMLLSYMLSKDLITAVFDESPERIGRNMGFSRVPVKSFDCLDEHEYSHCVVLAWNYFDSIMEKWPHKGKVLIRPLPIIETYES